MDELKSLAKCKPSEFCSQTIRIADSVEAWIKATDIANIRKRLPVLKKLTPEMTEEERNRTFTENQQISREQVLKNTMDIVRQALGEHPKETIELLALSCFVEPEDADSHTMDEYLGCVVEMLKNQAVMGFFTLLLSLDQKNILQA